MANIRKVDSREKVTPTEKVDRYNTDFLALSPMCLFLRSLHDEIFNFPSLDKILHKVTKDPPHWKIFLASSTDCPIQSNRHLSKLLNKNYK